MIADMVKYLKPQDAACVCIIVAGGVYGVH